MKTVRASRLVALGVLATVVTPCLAQAPTAAKAAASRPAASPATPSLYERLGGADAIAIVVDDFIERLLVNSTLNENPAIRGARLRVPKAGLKFHITTRVCQVTGGPCRDVGRNRKTSYAHLNIGEMEWEAIVADLRNTLNSLNVPFGEQTELITIMEDTKPEIVAPRKQTKRRATGHLTS